LQAAVNRIEFLRAKILESWCREAKGAGRGAQHEKLRDGS
jgi:hypothetical protein